MDYSTALERLNNHASLPSSETRDSEQSILYMLWIIERSRTPSNLDHLFKDIIECLEVINIVLNGEIPSEVPRVEKRKEIDRDLAYTVSQILRGMWEYHISWNRDQIFNEEYRQQLSLNCWAISCAWDAVLAGDIDSMKDDIEIESRVHGFEITL